ncbi:transglutaminase domain-containing protein [Streptomyces sp. YC419]|uniref:Transglutaminase domain-containing protein n=2 Tax=Streptomyces ureilyticus TaxID=1775131 RepID=A0ABX0E054_9ACTN|nr:transglutaminase domain-containing protein [Streptomyces ureilyticus]NGO44716.1 transglutaminase domain-containing protein [Streptomyces ureilyticus]
MPWRGAKVRPETAAGVGGSTRATAILDWEQPVVAALVERVRREAGPGADARAVLRVAHGIIAREVRPVYSVEDRHPASRTLRLGRGSCSQRMAVLEAVARAVGVRTRVRGLLVDGAFWYPRFPRLKRLVPERVLLAWPEFLIDREWVPIGELFEPVAEGEAFSNRGGETLFDAVARVGVDWSGSVSCGAQGGGAACDLSAQVLVDLGYFDSRDELFARHGQTLCRTARILLEPVLARWSAGARLPAITGYRQ